MTSQDALPPAEVDIGDPGGSLQAEYERRSVAREARVRGRFPRMGGLLLALFEDPASTKAFSKGAEGERRVAARLAELSGPGVLFLHNRKLGRGRRDGDVDHVALTAGGVFVIDAKQYKNAKVRVRRTGGLLLPVREQLMVNGRDRSKLMASVSRQREAVCEAVDTFRHAEVTGTAYPSSRCCASSGRTCRCSARPGSMVYRCSGPKERPSCCASQPVLSIRTRSLPSIDIWPKQCLQPESPRHPDLSGNLLEGEVEVGAEIVSSL